MLKVPSSESWRYANRQVKTFFNLNPSLLVFFLFTIFCFYTWSIALCIFLVIFFGILEYKGVSVFMAFRWFATQLNGRKKIIKPRWIK